MEAFDVTFRYIGIKTESGEIPCICLSFKSEQEAYLSFSFFHDYMRSADSLKTFRVEFIRQSKDLYSLSIKASFLARYFDTTISDISAVHVKKIIQQLKLFTYYIILAGYETTNGFHLLPVGTYHLFKRDIYRNGNEILGEQKCEFDWNSFLSKMKIKTEP